MKVHLKSDIGMLPRCNTDRSDGRITYRVSFEQFMESAPEDRCQKCNRIAENIQARQAQLEAIAATLRETGDLRA